MKKKEWEGVAEESPQFEPYNKRKMKRKGKKKRRGAWERGVMERLMRSREGWEGSNNRAGLEICEA
ncbi:hypothetical protein HYC85_014185 [Camellia sinensis]|uniref:Uncharacterized protein n=1 Tax=Camellia sinensis TaxID=4442 RepID=A0A7J7H8Y5_CAMSI|nr:hypothetical protein HYC85_014185 [Camellia sinensis]